MRYLPAASAALLAASPAAAHVDAAAHGSFAAGFAHPLGGADHALAMLAVGLWALVLGGRAIPLLPAAFVGAMTGGFLLARAGVTLPLVEPAILASVLLLGGCAALALRPPLALAAAGVAAFALFHGHAHGAEMGGASAGAFLAGFALATAALHAAGVAGGLALARLGGAALARGAGAGVAALGAALALAG
ncbi:MAG: HupE/UreJ family protein [Rhodobacteraceae bacterium]|nr:HupE/UreJ family protein [Paracoccaceae bacterium]